MQIGTEQMSENVMLERPFPMRPVTRSMANWAIFDSGGGGFRVSTFLWKGYRGEQGIGVSSWGTIV